jgi:hypothetical protein
MSRAPSPSFSKYTTSSWAREEKAVSPASRRFLSLGSPRRKPFPLRSDGGSAAANRSKSAPVSARQRSGDIPAYWRTRLLSHAFVAAALAANSSVRRSPDKRRRTRLRPPSPRRSRRRLRLPRRAATLEPNCDAPQRIDDRHRCSHHLSTRMPRRASSDIPQPWPR